jgi:toxin ParE1/3/4
VKLRFTPRAAANIAEIAEYIRQRNPSAAQRVRSSIYDGLQSLMLFPRVGRPQKQRDVRKLVTPRYAYLVYYLFDETNKKSSCST